MNRLLYTCLSIAALIVTPNIWAWGKTGHRVVGQVAILNMNKKALKNVNAVLGNEDIAISANWMDFVKSDSTYDYMKPWHYATIPDSISYAEEGTPAEGDIIVMIDSLKNMIINQSYNDAVKDEATAVKCIIHLVGDIHQPMHVGNGHDRGGNDIKLKYFWKKSNLHRVWDSGMIDNEKLSYSEYANWINTATQDQITMWQSSTVLDWANESKEYRIELYKELTGDDNFAYRYNYDNIYLLNQRLLQAGIRLAGIFNEIYG